MAMVNEEDPFAAGRDDLWDLQLQAASQRLAERRLQIPVLDQLASDRGIDDITSLESMVPLLFADTVYKSYSEAFVDGGRWDLLTKWLATLATPDFAAADSWSKAHESEGIIHYGFSKKAINAYVATQGYHLLKKGIRINAICPGPTDTPLAQANADLWLTFAQDYRDETGSKVHTPEQMGDVMAFLNSAAAFGINGITLLVDYGHTMASLTGAYPPGKPIIDLIMGRVQLT